MKYVSFTNAKLNTKIFFLNKTIWNFVMMLALLQSLQHQHNPTEWHLFTNPSRVNLAAVLLHHRNKFPSAPVAHAANMTKSYENIKLLL
jgi:hypothetical protein